VRSGQKTTLLAPPGCTMQEPVHIPSKTPGHEGYLAVLVDKHAENLTEGYLLEAEHPERGPIARFMIPMRLRSGVHGTWVPGSEL
jgi:carotenoid cleavage dioxygenase-like enzyme